MALLKFDVTITLESPLSIAMPGKKGAKPNGWGNFPVMQVGGYGDSEPEWTGYLPASTLRGALRRYAVLPLMKKRADDNNPYTLHELYMDLIGQDRDSEKELSELDLVALRESREANPIVDLFGSGLHTKSRLVVKHFVPEHSIRPKMITVVRKDLADTEGAVAMLNSVDHDEYIKRHNANRPRSQAVNQLKKLETEKWQRENRDEDLGDLEEQIKAAAALVKKHEADMGDMQVSTKGIYSHYALPQGLELQGMLVIRNFRDRDLEIIKRAFDGLSQMPILGAQSARGCGEISGEVKYEMDDGEHFIKFGGYTAAQCT